jgi:hypothetical protein
MLAGGSARMLQTEYRTRGYSLVTAAAKGDVGKVRAMLDMGADIHFEMDLALRSAAFTGHLEVMKLLVARGANLHARQEEALLYAAKRQNHEMTRYLLDRGASISMMRRHHAELIDDDCESTFARLAEGEGRPPVEKGSSIAKRPRPPRKNGPNFKL